MGMLLDAEAHVTGRVGLARAMTPLACARWTLYRTERHRLSLCDSLAYIDR